MKYYLTYLLLTASLFLTGCTITNEDGKRVDVRSINDVASFRAICFYPSGYPKSGMVLLYNSSKYQNLTYEVFGDRTYKCNATTFNSQEFLDEYYSKQ